MKNLIHYVNFFPYMESENGNFFRNAASWLDMKNDIKDVFQSLIDDYNIYDLLSNVKVGGSEDTNYYYSITKDPQAAETKWQSGAYGSGSYAFLKIITGYPLYSRYPLYSPISKEFIGEVKKNLKQLDSMGYECEFADIPTHTLDIRIKNKENLRKLNEDVGNGDEDLLIDIFQDTFDEYLVERTLPDIADEIGCNGLYWYSDTEHYGFKCDVTIVIFCNYGYVDIPDRDILNTFHKLIDSINKDILRLEKIGYEVFSDNSNDSKWESFILKIKFPK